MREYGVLRRYRRRARAIDRRGLRVPGALSRKLGRLGDHGWRHLRGRGGRDLHEPSLRLE